MSETQILRAALLWMRNQYDVGKPEHKQDAIDRIDAVLRDYEPTLSGMAEFRDAYARRPHESATSNALTLNPAARTAANTDDKSKA